MTTLPHPLSEYVSGSMRDLWSMEWQVVEERRWWLHIMEFMRDNSRVYDAVPFFDERLEAYHAVVHDVDLDSIAEQEKVTRHDVKARIEEFNRLATLRFWATYSDISAMASEMPHAGLTSADVVDNMSLIRIRRATTLLMGHFYYNPTGTLARMLSNLPLRGIRGPVGTQQDMLDLLGSYEKCQELDEYLADIYGFPGVFGSIGQVYPRSKDLEVASAVHMAVQESPNKHPWLTIINGYMSMIASYSGDQWNEGDVSTSAVRRVALPGLFLAADAALRGVKP